MGETLLISQKMQSPNSVHEITFLASGGLQLKNASLNTSAVNEPSLSSATAKSFTLGRDMVLQINDANNNSLWRSSNRHTYLNTTYAPPGPDGLSQLNGAPALILDNDCSIFIRNGEGKILWKISDIITSIGSSLTPGMTQWYSTSRIVLAASMVEEHTSSSASATLETSFFTTRNHMMNSSQKK